MLLNGQDAAAIAQAADALARGELVGLPTETVYGLAANASDDAAVARIYAAKGRPADHPLIVHVADAAAAQAFAASWPPFAQALSAAFWPGPLTVIVPRRAGVATAATGGQDSVGLRCPSHPVAQAVLRAAAERGVQGVAAPSANRFGRVSPTRTEHVVQELGDDLLVLDGGACDVGIESTIVDCTRDAPVLLRPGHITRHEIELVLGQRLLSKSEHSLPDPKASGTLASHYAPSARVRLMTAAQLDAQLASLGEHIAVYAPRSAPIDVPAGVHWQTSPTLAAQAEHDLFADLRALDALGVAQIWVQTPPDTPAWDGVRDRLQRAAA